MPLPDASPVWVVVQKGLIGTRKPCEAIAKALGQPYRVVEIDLPQPWKTIAPWMLTGLSLSLSAPWPKLVISAGRQGAAAAQWIKRQSPTTKLVHLMAPHISAKHFDLVVRPEHDGADGFTTTGIPAFYDAAALDAGESQWRKIFAPLPLPRVAVFLGGARKGQSWDDARIIRLIRQLSQLQAGIMISPSRRTPPDVVQRLHSALPDAFIWDGTGDNPYFGMIAFADAVIVTGDSVSTASEIATIGKPLYIADMGGLPPKLARFHRQLESLGISRLFTGQCNSWGYSPLREAERVATEIQRLNLLA